MKWMIEVGSVPDTVTVSGNCVFTGEIYAVKDIPKAQWDAFQKDTLAQRAFPLMSADDREFLISGISPNGWSECMGEERDEY